MSSPTIRACLTKAVATLTGAGITSAALDAQLLAAHVTGHDRAWILAHDDDQFSKEQSAAFTGLVQKRASRIPLVHLTHEREFYDLPLTVTPAVLTPRVETEQMVEWAIRYAPQSSRLIDIGTGSGAIAVAIGRHRPDLDLYASDLSETELKVARTNFRRHNVPVKLVASNLWAKIDGTYDTVVTNLPYLPDNADLMPEVQKEPAVALFGGADGLALYRRFLEELPAHLAPGGYLFTECDPWQHADLIAAANRVGLSPIEQGYFILGFKYR